MNKQQRKQKELEVTEKRRAKELRKRFEENYEYESDKEIEQYVKYNGKLEDEDSG
ncbi:MAG: hypothetical protein AABY22_25430 [Nanoarchaeota archaeon]